VLEIVVELANLENELRVLEEEYKKLMDKSSDKGVVK
jgi:hypothetical protein